MRRAGVLAVASALVSFVVPAAAATAGGSGAVVDSDRSASWQGRVDRDGPPRWDVPECRSAGCDRAEVVVRLPARLRDRPGGVEVAIRTVGATLDDGLGLAVYQHGRRVALADARIGTSRSVWLPKATARYTVYAFWNPFVPGLASDSVRYQGLVENEDARVEPVPRDLLPDLEALPQRVATFDTPPPFFGDAAEPGSSCFRSEVEERDARLCLRFGQAMANTGDGPVDVRYTTPAGQRPAEVPGAQRVHRSDGTFTDVPSVGAMRYHPIHSHYHFEDFSVSELWAVDEDGRPTGAAPAAAGKKNGFCMADTELAWWDRKGDAPQTYPAPRCLDPEPDSPPGVDAFKNGISRGWADEYWWALPDQMIEVSGLRDGTYALVTRVDPADRLRELDEDDNCVRVPVTLTGLTSGAPVATLGGPAVPCD